MTTEQNKSPPKHAPLPFIVGEKRQAGAFQLIQNYDQTRGYICEVMAPLLNERQHDEAQMTATTEFIVRACNSHYELLEALRALQKYASDLNCGSHHDPIWQQVANTIERGQQ